MQKTMTAVQTMRTAARRAAPSVDVENAVAADEAYAAYVRRITEQGRRDSRACEELALLVAAGPLMALAVPVLALAWAAVEAVAGCRRVWRRMAGGENAAARDKVRADGQAEDTSAIRTAREAANA